MKRETFFSRIEKGKANYYPYKKNGLIGMISVWKRESIYRLIWEEFKEGDQFNENAYTIDENYKFKNPDELCEFLEKNSLNIESFKPYPRYK